MASLVVGNTARSGIRTFTEEPASSYSDFNMEIGDSSETSVNFFEAACRYIPEDNKLHIHRCKYVRSMGLL